MARLSETTHVSAYYRGRGGRTTHPGTIWNCPHARCRYWAALVDHNVRTALQLTTGANQ